MPVSDREALELQLSTLSGCLKTVEGHQCYTSSCDYRIALSQQRKALKELQTLVSGLINGELIVRVNDGCC